MPSVGLENQQKMELTKDVPPQDQDALNFYLERLNSARDQRSEPRREFDDMSYEQDYALNQLVAHSYLRKKKNDDEVRVNTGTAEKKIELILNELMSMNFQPEVRTFDEDDLEVEKLGDDMGSVLKRTNEIERDEDIYEDAFLELLTQRALFMEEWYGPLPVASVRTGRTGKFKNMKVVQKRLLSGLQVFLGDVTIPAHRFQEQPYIVIYDRVLYEEAKREFGESENWEFVKPGMPVADNYGLWFKYRLGNLTNREVEIIRYYSAADNEWQVIINGVMMHEPSTPLPWNHGGYNITMTVVKSVSRFFAYGKPPLASAKFLQGLADETFRNLIRKMRQAIEPPLGVKSGRVYSKDIWSPAAVTQGLTGEEFARLTDHDGVTSSEFQMLELITSKVEEFVGPYGAEQTPGAGTPTATQVVEQQKQSMKMLGLAMLAAMRVKRDMSYLRLWNVFENYFEPVGNGKNGDKYRKFTVDQTDLGDGATGKKVISLADDDMTDSELEQTLDLEEYFENNGKPVRYRSINVKKLSTIPLTWYIVVSSQERDSGALDKVMFQDKIAQAANVSQITGRNLNADKLIDGFERTWKDKGLFERDAPVAGGDVRSNAQAMLAEMENMEAEGAQPPETLPSSDAGQALTPSRPPQLAGTTALANAP